MTIRILLFFLFLNLFLIPSKTSSAQHWQVRDWSIQVVSLENEPSLNGLRDQAKLEGAKRAPETLKQLAAGYAIVNDLLKTFLSNASDQEIVSQVKYLTGHPDLLLEQLDNRILVSYFARGEGKIVFKVSFFPHNNSLGTYDFLLLVPRIFNGIFQAEIDDMKKVHNKRLNVIPRIGYTITTDRGPAFFSELIDGPDLNKLGADPRREELSAKGFQKIMFIYSILGYLPIDMRPHHVLIHHFNQPDERVIIIDLGWRRSHQPQSLFPGIIRGFALNKPESFLTQSYNLVVEAMGQEKGKDFLAKVLNYWHDKRDLNLNIIDEQGRISFGDSTFTTRDESVLHDLESFMESL